MDEELRNDITELVKEMVSSEQPADEQPSEKPIELTKEQKDENIRALRNKFFSPEPMKDLERVSTMIQLRDALVDAGYSDPGLPAGHAFVPGTDTVAQCENSWNALRHCVEIADGSDEYFRAELAKIMPDKKIF